MTDLWQLSASEIARRMRRREISSREVIESHLRRIEALNPTLNALTVVLADEALAAADAADRRRRRGCRRCAWR